MSGMQVPVTKICESVCIIEWDIENYARLSAGKSEAFYFTSTTFEILAATWNLHLYPNALQYDDPCNGIFNRYVSIFLEKKFSKVKDHHVLYNLDMKVRQNFVGNFSENVCFKDNSRYGKRDFLKVDSCPFLSQAQTVTVILQMYPTDSTIQQVKCHPDFSVKTSEGVNLLSTNMKNLYLNQQDCDFTIRVKTQEFKVHKVILAAQSPVLYSKLHNDMAESRTGIVDIVDSEPDVFENFLLYLYSGQIDGLSWKNVTQLFMLGDKYDLQYLKNKCRSYMLSHICKDGFCDVVVLAIKHNEPLLLKCAEDYFIKNAKSILSSKKWQEFLYENPIACNELFLKFVSSLSSDSE